MGTVKRGAMLVMPKLTPLGGGRGISFACSWVCSRLLTGTPLRLSNTAKDDPVGPKGWNRGTSRSAPKTEVPAASCVVTTSRGLEAGEGIILDIRVENL